MREIKRIFRDKMPAFLATVIVGIISHGFMMFNKFSYHDDMMLFNLGGTVDLGRWGLHFIYTIFNITDLGWFSVPLFMGSFSLFFIGAGAVFVCDILNIKSKTGMIFLGGIMVAFPVVASTFAYMFTAVPYFFAYFLMILAVRCLSRKHHMKSCLAAAFLIALSTGIYQAALAVCASLMVLTLIDQVIEYPDRILAVHFKEAMLYAGTFLGGVVLYFCENRLVLMITGSELSSYQGIDEKYDITRLPDKLLEVYRLFGGGGYIGINSTHFLSNGVKVVIGLTAIGVLAALYQSECDKITKLWTLFLMMIFPIAACLVTFFSTGESLHIHTLMVYSLVYVFIFPIYVMERIKLVESPENKKSTFLMVKLWKYMLVFMITIFIIIYAYYDNAAYLKINFVQEQTIAYLNTLVTQIKSVDGYKDEYPVVLLGYKYSIEDQSFFHSDEFDKIAFTGYQYDQKTLVNDYLNIRYMQYHIGYDPVFYYDYTDWWELPEVKEMSCYPDNGSIRVINEGVVVKFAEYEEK